MKAPELFDMNQEFTGIQQGLGDVKAAGQEIIDSQVPFGTEIMGEADVISDKARMIGERACIDFDMTSGPNEPQTIWEEDKPPHHGEPGTPSADITSIY